MLIDRINNQLIPHILTSKSFRIYRHSFLFLIIGIITYGLNPRGEYKSNISAYYEWGVFFLAFTAIIYTNMYILIPQFLLKKKASLYLLFLVASVLLLLFLLIVSQFIFHEVIRGPNSDFLKFLFNLLNVSIVVGLVVACFSSFVLFKNWVVYNQQIDELNEITLAAELQMLKDQINPHFLFNMLNNANIMIKRDARIASVMLTQLDQLLSYQIGVSKKDEVILVDDISFLTDYLELEKSRRDRFKYTLIVEGDLKSIKTPPLLFIPFVENAVKHSAEAENTSYVNIIFKLLDGQLVFYCENSIPRIPLKQGKDGGLGLVNIRRRLGLLYKNRHTLKVIETETIYNVILQLNL